MKRALVIGAGHFGRMLVDDLLAKGFAVDVMDRDAAAEYPLRMLDIHFICNNGWNLPAAALPFAEYACCYVCIGPNQWMNRRIVEALRAKGVRQIVVRVHRRMEAQDCRDAGADRVICPDEFTSHALAAELEA